VLGEIKKIELRKVWKKEACDFTPWLAENLDKIGEIIGLELELKETEVSAGPFSADILAKDIGTNNYVIIENQLTKTNHDHLGKCITYASVLDAMAIIWIAAEFTDEHKKALDWLNDHTSDEIEFYGIKVELWQIDHSQPAVKLNVISEPNIAVREATKHKELGDLSDAKKLQLDFWTAFKENFNKSTNTRLNQRPRPQYWFDIPLGITGIHISNTFNTDTNEIGARIYIRNQKVYDWLPYFESQKKKIESDIGCALSWNPNPNNQDKVITLTKYFDLTQDENWKEAINWLCEYTIKFKDVFSKIIQEKT
jgi:hypothetical protein